MKIYLSKSKAGSFDDIVKTKNLLQAYLDIEMLEFTGGQYSYDKLSKCSLMILLPPELPQAFMYKVRIGKGQYDECMYAFRNKIPVYVVLIVSDAIYVYGELESKDIILSEKQEWTKDFAVIECHSEYVAEFDTIMSTDFGTELELKPLQDRSPWQYDIEDRDLSELSESSRKMLEFTLGVKFLSPVACFHPNMLLLAKKFRK